VNDTTLIQFLIDYPVNADGSIDEAGASLQRIYDTTLLPSASTNYFCGYRYETHEEYYCVEVLCGEGGDHNSTQPCDDGVQRGHWSCGWRMVSVAHQVPCESLAGSGSPTGGGPSGGGASGGGTCGSCGDSDPPPSIDRETLIQIGLDPNLGEPELQIVDPNCEEVQNLLNDQTNQSAITNLKRNLPALRREVGFKINYDKATNTYSSVFNPNTSGDSDGMEFVLDDDTVGNFHIHYNDYTTRTINPNNPNQFIVKNYAPIKLPSLTDVTFLYDAVLNTQSATASELENGLNAKKAFCAAVSSEGVYVLKYTGSPNAVPPTASIEVLQSEEIQEEFIEALSESPEEGFLKFIRDSSLINGQEVELFKQNNNGVLTKLELDDNNQLKSKPC
jgi:hypothetical protein